MEQNCDGMNLRRAISKAHEQLLQKFEVSEIWSAKALHSCLSFASIHRPEEEWGFVQVCDADTLGDNHFFVCFFPVLDFSGQAYCVVRGKSDLDRRYTYSGDAWVRMNAFVPTHLLWSADEFDPIPFGQDVAESDILESLGRLATECKIDSYGLRWFGNVFDGPPEIAPKLAQRIVRASTTVWRP